MMSNQLYNNKRLDEWLDEQNSSKFPGNRDYPASLRVLKDYFVDHIYPDIEKGALYAEFKKGGEPVYLNNHGQEHVDQVISRVTDILRESQCKITPYEAYLLLAAIHLHDAGNIYGRENHERKCREILLALGPAVVNDSAEKRVMFRIASAHGGTVNGSKDTIGRLQTEFSLLGHPVRKQFLAALLRFADELADDRTRSSRFMLEGNDIPKGSEVYHAYSQSLRSVVVAPRDIKLDFELSKSMALRNYRKGKKSTYLLDEIYSRTLKMHLERMYCMRFLRSEISIDSIRVKIGVFDDTFMKELIDLPSYFLEETGYPYAPAKGIQELCPELCSWTGEILKEKLLSLKDENNGEI